MPRPAPRTRGRVEEMSSQDKPCKFFSRGRCKNGANCTFLHFDVTVTKKEKQPSPSKRAREPLAEESSGVEKKQKTEDAPQAETESLAVIEATGNAGETGNIVVDTDDRVDIVDTDEQKVPENAPTSPTPTSPEKREDDSVKAESSADQGEAGAQQVEIGVVAGDGETTVKEEQTAVEEEQKTDKEEQKADSDINATSLGVVETSLPPSAPTGTASGTGKTKEEGENDLGPVLSGVFGRSSLEQLQASQILVLGDGNMSFSLALAKRLGTGGEWQMQATTLDSRATIEKKYRGSLETLDALRKLEPQVWSRHDIDVGCLNHLAAFRGKNFDCIIWNFPIDERLGRTETSSEDRPRLIAQLLITLFFQASTALLQGGLVHLTLDSKSRTVKTVIEQAKRCSFTLVGHRKMTFEEWPGYETRCEKEDRQVKIKGEPVILTFRQAQNSEEVFVGNVAARMTSKQLESHFSVCGPIKMARLVKDQSSMRNKGFAFVSFQSPENALQAVKELHHTILVEKKISVEFSKMQPPLRPEPVPCRHFPEGPVSRMPERRRGDRGGPPRDYRDAPRGGFRGRDRGREPPPFRERPPLEYRGHPPPRRYRELSPPRERMRYQEPRRYQDEPAYEDYPPRRVLVARRGRMVYPEPEVDYMPVYLPRERSRSPRRLPPSLTDEEIMRARKRRTPPPRYTTDIYRVADMSPPRGAAPRATLRPVRGEAGYTTDPYTRAPVPAETRRRVMVARKTDPSKSSLRNYPTTSPRLSSATTTSSSVPPFASGPPPPRQPARSADYSHYLEY